MNFYKYEDGSGYDLEFELWIDYQQSDLTISVKQYWISTKI
ncbi:DUF7668 domain-containing protein [Gottfriedia acidiceleris]